MVKVISAPANIICSFLSGYFSQDKPFTFVFQVTLFYALASSYSILVLIRNFPKDPELQSSPQNLLHMTVVALATELIGNFWFTTNFAIIMKIIDKRIAGIHITLLASLVNFV